MKTEKCCVWPHVGAVCLMFLVCLAPPLIADPLTPVRFGDLKMGAVTEEIVAAMGPPAFTAESILMYSRTVATPEGAVPADLTLWFASDALFFASYAFPVTDRTPTELADQFEAISQALRAAFTEASSHASSDGSFTTEVWNLDDLDIEHTLILVPGRIGHVVTLTSGK